MIRRVTAAFVLLVTAACAAVASRHSAETLPFYDSAEFTPTWSETPARPVAFELTSQLGTTVTGAELAGRPHVAAFLFTRCTTLCPSLVTQLKRVQAATAVTIVTYSVTPDLDTPAVLNAFGARAGLNPTRWLLLTGNRDVIYRLARGFYFADDARPGVAANEFLHTERVLLVDGRGRLRGVYDGTQPFDIDRLIGDVNTLAR